MAAALLLGAAIFIFGLLAHNHFPNDHFVHLSCAAQMLAGEWPTRDFADPGMPLMYVSSAAAQWLGGRTLLAEAVLVYGAFAAGAGLLALAVARLTSSTLLGLWAGAFTALIAPRTYSYPKILLYAAAVHLFVGSALSPSRRVSIALAALTTVGFLFRHDHGIFLGAASVAFVWASATSVQDRLRRIGRYAAMTLLLTAPYLAFVHAHGGLPAYVRSTVDFSRQEARRTALTSWTPSVRTADARAAAAAALFYAFWALPAAAGVVAWSSKQRHPAAAAAAGAVSVVAVAANAAFLRDRLEDRIADAVVPAVTLAAFLAAWAVRRQQRPVGRAAAMAVVCGALLASSIAAATVGRIPEAFARSGIAHGLPATVERGVQVTSELLAPRAAPQLPSAIALALVPFFEYVETCTRASQLIFVPGFAPEVPYFVRRRFAGGHVTLMSEYYSSEDDERRTVALLKRQSVPLVVLPPGSPAVLARHHPQVWEWLRQYERLAAYRDHQDRTTEVWVRRGLPAPRRHLASGFPCFR